MKQLTKPSRLQKLSCFKCTSFQAGCGNKFMPLHQHDRNLSIENIKFFLRENYVDNMYFYKGNNNEKILKQKNEKINRNLMLIKG
jgi:hypothetical protein